MNVAILKSGRRAKVTKIKLLALVASVVVPAAVPSAASAAVFHYTFSSDSYYSYSSTVRTPVTGSFDFNTADGALSNVDYTSVSGHFITGAEYTPGVPTEIYFGDRGSSNYDVYQLASSLAGGGTVSINSGTHPNITISAGGSLTPSAVSAVPEPATWAMMIGGFGMAGGALRRRRQTAAPVFAA